MVAGTPPADLLARKSLLGQSEPYQLVVDTRFDSPARADGRGSLQGIDAALLWGPIAGYWAKQQKVPIKVDAAGGDRRTGLRLDFRISMGLRRNEPEWKPRSTS